MPGAARRAGIDGASEAVTAEQLWTKYAARLTSVVVRYLRADYWHMPQASSPLTTGWEATACRPRLCGREPAEPLRRAPARCTCLEAQTFRFIWISVQ